MKPRAREASDLRAELAQAAVLDQASSALPADPAQRAVEGARRNQAAQRQVAQAAKAARGCDCQPGDAMAWGRAIAEAVQIVYRVLVTLGIIRASGQRVG